MRIITKRRLTDFYKKHADAKSSLLAWHKNTSVATWQNLVELKAAFPSADLVSNFTIFNIGGNKYRLIAFILHSAGYLGQKIILPRRSSKKL